MAVGAQWTGQSRIKGSSESVQMALLTASMIGLQFAWGSEMTYASPYLLSLGLSKSKLSLVWIAGPLSGLIMQPVIGMISDHSKSKYGRRRPFMVVGTAAVVICLLVLGWTQEVVGWFVQDRELARKLAITAAVVDIYVLDFVINIAQSTCRALVVDALPVEKQQLGSAWCSRMAGIGHMSMYALGALDLKSVTGNFLGDTQFKKVCAIAAVAMAVAQGTSCWAVTERVYLGDAKTEDQREGVVSILRQIYSATLNVPERIQAICMVQFWAWIGWFPFLFYGSTWVGEIYIRHDSPATGGDALTEVGKAGSAAYLAFAIISFGSSIVLPWLVQSPGQDDRPGYTPRAPESLQSAVTVARKNRPTLLTAWMLACLVFAASMVFAPFVKSVRSATIIIALCGVPFAVGGWAPGTFLGVEVNRMSSAIPMSQIRRVPSRRPSNESSDASTLVSHSSHSSPRTLHLRHSSNASSVDNTSTGELSGIYLGILNIYTTLPQFVGTGISWVVFSLLEPGKSPELATEAHPSEHHSTEGVSGIAVCLFIGAMSALVAAWATRRLKIAG
ncbi:hypothetical protein LTR53_010447 [Teratosphaeriaceae sp. CCFEE 6253]|nr:hypothetical protein LTR53_010447 [Teratosphaeriaceae sp. CCFEE 6253]